MINIPFILQIPVGVSMESAFGHDIVQMILHAGPMVKFVMLILLFFSTVSWGILFVKLRLFRKAKQENAIFLELFWEENEWKQIYRECKDFKYSPVAILFRTGYSELHRGKSSQASLNSREGGKMPDAEFSQASRQSIMANMERSLKKSMIDQSDKLERTISFLATTGNTAPFIGLFGTVWGIMGSFRGIGLKGSANLAVVAPGISEALIATAAGLAVAIPAVMAFNMLTQRISVLKTQMDILLPAIMITDERQSLKNPF